MYVTVHGCNIWTALGRGEPGTHVIESNYIPKRYRSALDKLQASVLHNCCYGSLAGGIQCTISTLATNIRYCFIECKVEVGRFAKWLLRGCANLRILFLYAATADSAAYDLWPHHLVSWEAGCHAVVRVGRGAAAKGVGGTEPRKRETGLYNCWIVFIYTFNMYMWWICPGRGYACHSHLVGIILHSWYMSVFFSRRGLWRGQFTPLKLFCPLN